MVEETENRPTPVSSHRGLVILLLAWMTLALLASQGGAKVVKGVISLRSDGMPVAGVAVRYTDGLSETTETITDLDGTYSIDLLTSTAVDEVPQPAARTTLGAAYPNPFNPTVVIPFELVAATRVRLEIFNILGHRVRLLLDQEMPIGGHEAYWQGQNDSGKPVAAGLYMFRFSAGEFRSRGKLTLLDGSGSVPNPSALATAPVVPPDSYTVQVLGEAIEGFRVDGVYPLESDFDGSFEVNAESIFVTLKGGMETKMMGVPGGPFEMGGMFYQNELPSHVVHLDPYYIEMHEVTQAQYRACVEAGDCREPAIGETCNWAREGREDHPVNCISWFEAEDYCQWAGMRLPTEAEWEKAARGHQRWLYPWGDKAPGGSGDCDRAIMMKTGAGFGCGHDGTAPVGSLPNSVGPFGTLDMAGNVWEWVADWFDKDYYAASPLHNPFNAAEADYKVIRGNSWYYVDPDPDFRSANRYRFRPLRWYPYIGVRCVMSGSNPLADFETTRPTEVEDEVSVISDWFERTRAAMAAQGDTIPESRPPIEMEMVHIPTGDFIMGYSRGAGDVRPERTITLHDYYIDKYEVTVAQFRECVDGGVCEEPYGGPTAYRLQFEGYYTTYDKPWRDNYPVNTVSWFEANKYCRWVGKRLPTEAEWEKAARGTDGRLFPWGNEEPDCSRVVMDDGGDGCGQESPWPVGSKPLGASPYGVMDMSGNVWEWVADWYEHGYYTHGPLEDPFNDTDSGRKVQRGGSLADQNQHKHRSSLRLGYGPTSNTDYTVGFRCASDELR